MRALHHISAGFMPLLDSAVLVAAAARGFAEAEGIDLRLTRESSWANIRDRLAVGHFQIAHALAPMPIAGNLGLAPLAARMIVPMALGLGGNAVTVSTALWMRMTAGGPLDNLDPADASAALKRVVAQGNTALRFAVVHPHSGHNYVLRYWLAASGIDPNRDIEIVILPPPLMADALAAGTIDGFCVGEPWNSIAAQSDHGRIATVTTAIWRSSPEKVLGVDAAWSEAHPEALQALLRALFRAAQWCGDAANAQALAALLSRAEHVGCPIETLLPAITGELPHQGATMSVADFWLPYAKAATFPWKSHALWFYTQMVRWGQVRDDAGNQAIAFGTYRPDLYRAALKPLGVPLPGASAKFEGALTAPISVGSSDASLVLGPDGFFDGGLFDPDRIDDYIASQRNASA